MRCGLTHGLLRLLNGLGCLLHCLLRLLRDLVYPLLGLLLRLLRGLRCLTCGLLCLLRGLLRALLELACSAGDGAGGAGQSTLGIEGGSCAAKR